MRTPVVSISAGPTYPPKSVGLFYTYLKIMFYLIERDDNMHHNVKKVSRIFTDELSKI